MKRLGLTLVTAIFMASAAFAAGNQPTTAKWEGNINVAKLSKYLNLTSTQREQVENICDFFSKQVTNANNSQKNQNELFRKAVYTNLKLMKQTLNDKQYSDYIRVLNTTLQNKGIDVK